VTSPGALDVLPALAAMPLFPLPTVLFPEAILPLHVFEPRYRAMVRAALDTHRTIAVVFIADASKVDAHGHPQLARVAGAGLIVDYAELPGGRFNILLRGRARVSLEELPFEPPYRRAKAEVLEPPDDIVPESEASGLVSAATAFAARVRERDPSFVLPMPKRANPPELADLFAHHLVLDGRERQAILETLDPKARVQRVAAALALQRLSLSPDTGKSN
jgi:ATP-dependent Lon protease